MQAVTVSDLKLAKAKLEKDINSLLIAFELMNDVTVKNLRLNTYSDISVVGALPTRYSKVEVEIIL